MKTILAEGIDPIGQMKAGVLRLHRPRVVALHHNNEDVSWARTWTSGRDPFEAIIQRLNIFRRGIKSSRSRPNITIGQKDLEPGRPLHGCLLPNRPAQREEWIEHNFIEKYIPGRGR